MSVREHVIFETTIEIPLAVCATLYPQEKENNLPRSETIDRVMYNGADVTYLFEDSEALKERAREESRYGKV
jgi:hypothetical protein